MGANQCVYGAHLTGHQLLVVFLGVSGGGVLAGSLEGGIIRLIFMRGNPGGEREWKKAVILLFPR